MKVRLVYIALFALAIFSIPLLALRYSPLSGAQPAPVHSPSAGSDRPAEGTPAAARPANPASESEPPPEEDADFGPDLYTDAELGYEKLSPGGAGGWETAAFESRGFKILDLSTGRVNEVSALDYVRGAVAAEMPVSFHTEALRAQAVAAHTYALHQQAVQRQSPDPTLKGADFSADPAGRKGYMTEQAAREFFGGGAVGDRHWATLCEAVDSVADLVMQYEGEPIVAAYHAMSAGRTEDAANVWEGEAPYLRPADSQGDYLAPGYETVLELPEDEVRSVLLAHWPEAELGGDPERWFADIERSDSGYITGVEVGGVPLHGKELREAFGLRSHNIEIETHEGRFYFYVYGYGHGVGLSQYGADFLARQGYTFDEILQNYYTGVSIRQLARPEAGE